MSKSPKGSANHNPKFSVLLITFTVICLRESQGDGIACQNKELISQELGENSLTKEFLNISPTIQQPIITKSRLTESIHSSEAKSSTTLVPSLLACILSFLLIISYGNRRTKGKLWTGFIGPSPLPIIGSLYAVPGSPEQILPKMSTLFQKHGGRFLFWFGYTPIVVSAKFQDVEKVLSSSKFVQKSKIYDKCVKWTIGDGLVTSEAKTWKVDRKMLNPAFNYQQFDGFLDSFNKHGNVLVSILSQRSNVNVEGQDLLPNLAMCTADSILESALGVPSDLQNNPDTEILEMVNSNLESIRVRIFKPWLSFPIIREIFGRANEERQSMNSAKNVFGKLFNKRTPLTGANDLENEKTKPLVDALLGVRSDDNIFDHIMTIFTAGFDTTARGLNYVLYLLALHPDHQAKVHEELDLVFENNLDRDVTFSDLAKIKYLEMCIKEALRLFPPVPLIARLIESDLQLEEDIVVPKNTEVAISIYHVHRDPRVYPDPEKFDPERFLPTACANRSLYAYIPFSLGPRNCIGQKYAMLQLKVLLTCILRTFSVSTTLNREDLKPIPTLFLENNVEIPVNLTKRIL